MYSKYPKAIYNTILVFCLTLVTETKTGTILWGIKGKEWIIKYKSNSKYIANFLYRLDRFALSIHKDTFSFLKNSLSDFLGGPVVKHGFNPW